MKELKDLKILEIKKINALSDVDLQSELKRACKDQFVLTMRLKVGELKQTHLIKVLRRYIAVLNTVITSK